MGIRLVIGGCAQGKLDYVRRTAAPIIIEETAIWDGELPPACACGEALLVVNHLHCWIKKRLAAGAQPQEELGAFLNAQPDCVLICDEIGNGIVPMEADERAYRECTGRILVELAKQADCVERVLCGIGQRIK